MVGVWTPLPSPPLPPKSSKGGVGGGGLDPPPAPLDLHAERDKEGEAQLLALCLGKDPILAKWHGCLVAKGKLLTSSNAFRSVAEESACIADLKGLYGSFPAHVHASLASRRPRKPCSWAKLLVDGMRLCTQEEDQQVHGSGVDGQQQQLAHGVQQGQGQQRPGQQAHGVQQQYGYGTGLQQQHGSMDLGQANSSSSMDLGQANSSSSMDLGQANSSSSMDLGRANSSSSIWCTHCNSKCSTGSSY